MMSQSLEVEVRRHLDVWCNVLAAIVESRRSGPDPRAREIKKLADAWEKRGAHVEADWLRRQTATDHFEQALGNVRAYLAANELGPAFTIYQRFEQERWHIAALLDQPDIKRGRKVAHSLPGATPPGRKKGENTDRNVAMARQFLDWQNSPRRSAMSATAKKEEIGARHGLGRSASIEAINDGLKKVSGTTV